MSRARHPALIHDLGGNGTVAEQLTVEGIHGHKDDTMYVIGNGGREGGREEWREGGREGGMEGGREMEGVHLFHFKIHCKSDNDRHSREFLIPLGSMECTLVGYLLPPVQLHIHIGNVINNVDILHLLNECALPRFPCTCTRKKEGRRHYH